MCSEGVARAFRSSYPALGILSMLVCLHAVCTCPPLHAEFYTTTAMPINGTLQAIQCNPAMSIHLSDGRVLEHCERVVDQPERLQVSVYHVSMGMPFLACCMVGAIFCSLTKKDDTQMFNVNMLFTPDTYSPVHGAGGDSAGSMYTWEVIFWAYILCVHLTLLPAITSPVDVFDTAVVVVLGILCIMFLCRPRGEDLVAGGAHAIVLVALVTCAWVAFTSIPHIYESDRLWLLAVLVLLDGLLLLVHMYDGVPTMYTIVMGRLTFVSLTNLTMAYAFYTLGDRLEEYVQEPENTTPMLLHPMQMHRGHP